MTDETYTPKSHFVWLAANNEVPLTGSAEGHANLRLLMRFMEDADKSNRDWATMALGMYGPDTEDTRRALLAAADDEDCDVRGEAIEALAKRDVNLALPLVQRELSRPKCGYGVFTAASLIAAPCLVEDLKSFDRDTDAPWVDSHIRDAIRDCEKGEPTEVCQN